MTCLASSANVAASLRPAPRVRVGRQLSVRPRASAFLDFFRPKPRTPRPPPPPSPVQPLLDVLRDTSRGVDVSSSQLKEIKARIEELRQLYCDVTTTDTSLSATWRLLFTTEQATAVTLPCLVAAC